MADQERIKLLELKVENLMRRIVLLEARPIVGLGAGGPLVFDSTLIDAWDSLGGEDWKRERLSGD